MSDPKLVVGQIASDDRFFENNVDKENVSAILSEVLCVEMEGAVIAQVCFEYNIPLLLSELFWMRQMKILL